MLKSSRVSVALIGIALFIVAFNWIVLLPSFIPTLDFTSSKVANIGTAINGLSAPILTLFSAYLLYLALSKQTESNETQKLKNDVDIIFLLYNQLDSEFNQMTYTVRGSRRVTNSNIVSTKTERYVDVHVGYDALYQFSISVKSFADHYNAHAYADKLKSILTSYVLIQRTVSQLKSDQEIKSILQEKLVNFYITKLREPLKSLCFHIRDNKDSKSSIVMKFLKDQERVLGVDFDMHIFNDIRQIFPEEK